MPATVSNRPTTVSACALTSWTPIQSAATPSAQASKPLFAAERMPFRFKETRRNTTGLSDEHDRQQGRSRAGLREVRSRGRRVALRRIQDQGRATIAVLFQLGLVR